MAEAPRTVVSFITAPAKDAETIATAIVERKLAACVNIVPSVQSIFAWEGKIENVDEALMLVKTTEAAVPSLVETLDEIHPYDNFELITVDIEGGSAPYLDWIRDTVER
jgi:periplasmic divalent cation tolerance protein